MEFVQPAEHDGDAITDLPPDTNAAWVAAIGAEIVDGLHVHAEILASSLVVRTGSRPSPERRSESLTSI